GVQATQDESEEQQLAHVCPSFSRVLRKAPCPKKPAVPVRSCRQRWRRRPGIRGSTAGGPARLLASRGEVARVQWSRALLLAAAQVHAGRAGTPCGRDGRERRAARL